MTSGDLGVTSGAARAGRLRKHWRYVAVWGPTVSVCAARVSVGPFTQEFWAVWDTSAGRLDEHTRRLPGRVRLPEGRLEVRDAGTRIDVDLAMDPVSAREVTTPLGPRRTWTRKTLGRATGRVVVGGRELEIDGVAMIDDSDGHHPRRTEWWWSAGCGTLTDGRTAAWNLVVGINDTPGNSENTVWLDGVPAPVGPAVFDPALASVTVDGARLDFDLEAERSREENLLVVASSYRQPFGTFAGTLPGTLPGASVPGPTLASGRGVMEHHTALW